MLRKTNKNWPYKIKMRLGYKYFVCSWSCFEMSVGSGFISGEKTHSATLPPPPQHTPKLDHQRGRERGPMGESCGSIVCLLCECRVSVAWVLHDCGLSVAWVLHECCVSVVHGTVVWVRCVCMVVWWEPEPPQKVMAPGGSCSAPRVPFNIFPTGPLKYFPQGDGFMWWWKPAEVLPSTRMTLINNY